MPDNLTLRAGVMGWPVHHSLSPRLHGYWLKKYGIHGTYDALPVEPQHLETALRGLPKRGFRGVNLTIPHKEAAAKIVDRLDSHAVRIGAVNLVIVGEDEKLEGRNTDAYGFAENLRAAGFAFSGGATTVLGAGGAARAVIAALQDMGCADIRLVNRTQSKAENLAKDFGVSVHAHGWDDVASCLREATLLVNTTALGMAGQPSLDVDLAPLPSTAWVTDIVYAPLETDLLRRAALRGLKTVDGLGMLLHQARPAFKAWFGVDAEVTDELRVFLLTN